jgi:hypothetical protein
MQREMTSLNLRKRDARSQTIHNSSSQQRHTNPIPCIRSDPQRRFIGSPVARRVTTSTWLGSSAFLSCQYCTTWGAQSSGKTDCIRVMPRGSGSRRYTKHVTTPKKPWPAPPRSPQQVRVLVLIGGLPRQRAWCECAHGRTSSPRFSV